MVDPAGGAAASWRAGGQTLSVPGDRSRDLNTSAGHITDAPRVLRPVTGDFTAEVTIPPFPRVQREAIVAGKSNAYHGASLIVWVDSQNFLRFDRGGLVDDRDGAPQFRFKLSRHPGAGVGKMRRIAEGLAHLQVERRGDTLIARTSDGRTWSDYESATLPSMPAEVRVDVAAINTGADEFTPRFKDSSLRPAPPR